MELFCGSVSRNILIMTVSEVRAVIVAIVTKTIRLTVKVMLDGVQVRVVVQANAHRTNRRKIASVRSADRHRLVDFFRRSVQVALRAVDLISR